MKAKIWRATLEGTAQFAITDNAAFMIGSQTSFIKVNENGTTIYGPTSTVAGSESIKTGGMFAGLPNLIQTLPSTMVSPVPAQIPSPPLNIGFNLADDVGYFAMLLA